MAKFSIGSANIPFPTIPVFTPQERAKLIVQVAIEIGKVAYNSLSDNAPMITIDQEVDLVESCKSAANLVYQAEAMALPPKVPQNS